MLFHQLLLWIQYLKYCLIVDQGISISPCPILCITNETATMYKQLANLAIQQCFPKDINELKIEEIDNVMKDAFNPIYFIARERF